MDSVGTSDGICPEVSHSRRAVKTSESGQGCQSDKTTVVQPVGDAAEDALFPAGQQKDARRQMSRRRDTKNGDFA